MTNNAPSSRSAESAAPDVIIVGPLRAGTTLLRLMLNNHPQIAVVGEFEESVAMLDDSGFPSAPDYRAWLAQHRTAVSRNYQSLETLDNYPQIARSLWSQLARSELPSDSTKSVVGCTIHSRFDRAHELWPNAKLIHITRDPRDVSNSCIGMGWVGHAVKGVQHWIEPTKRWTQLENQLDDSQHIQIRYEDLLADPESTLTKCCELFDLSYDERMLDFHESSTYQKLDPKLAEQWKRKMNPRTAEIIDSICLDQMSELGYETSVPTPKPASSLESITINLQDRIGRFRWRIRKYGLPLVLQWSFAKRLPITNSFRMRVRKQINEINLSNLR